MRIFLLSTLFSISFFQSFIVPQRPIFNLLKWEEINSNQILIQKVGPLVNTTLNSSEITSFYYSDSKPKGILKGEIFSEFNTICKRPEGGISPIYWSKVIGKKSKREFKADDFIFLK